MIATIALYIVGIFGSYLAYEMAMNAPKHPKQKWWWRIGLAACGIIGLGLTIWQCNDTQKKEVENNSRFAALTNKQGELERSFQTKSDNIESKMFALQQIQQSILITMATNSAMMTPELRQRILDSDIKFQGIASESADLNVWMAAIKGQQRDKRASLKLEHDRQAVAHQARYVTAMPYFNYTVTTFTNLLSKVAKLRGERFDLNWRGFPHEISQDGEDRITIAEIKFDTNDVCHYEIIMSTHAIQLGINGNGDSFDINAGGNGSLTASGNQTTRFQAPAEDYKSVIDLQLNEMIGDLDERIHGSKK